MPSQYATDLNRAIVFIISSVDNEELDIFEQRTEVLQLQNRKASLEGIHRLVEKRCQADGKSRLGRCRGGY